METDRLSSDKKTSVRIDPAFADEIVRCLEEMGAVTRLDLIDCEDMIDIAAASSFVSLQQLWLCGCKKLHDLAPLRNISSIAKNSATSPPLPPCPCYGPLT
jgi:hypothetical protein